VRLLTARLVADRLGVSVETVLRWARRGRLPAVYLSSRAIRFREDDLETWLAERATPQRGVLPTTPDAAHGRTLPSTALPTTDDEE
jgi:excisionase family DNA binding protein